MKNEAQQARNLRLEAANRLIRKQEKPEHIAPKERKNVRRVVPAPLELRVDVAKVS